ncbi:oxidoreductase with NAD(P)-binding Rossmann-fold domain [Legionella beliardensis]|uniref:Oxidoreductase with NAD(P)-binding Rossmann-fold domain n=1 Tax=Legionella beliardensis TaxID=91822 RepID=A0A378I096_9GAMM|nr:SDR family NAD(P)-dependent oxidoreductase [Legionella beliardensis]STX28413.1 oxidoreductase with NAD(P)-binding Rossmann-fold domain [Legionella beliardensis]
MRKSQTILITGCSSGIGYDTAITLAKRGHQVIASCRKPDDLQKLLDLGLDAILLDVNDSQSIHKAFAEMLSKTGGRLDVLINNAGYGQGGALEDISRDTLRAQFETNVFGLLEITRLAIPVMRSQGSGRIINISSVLGLVSMKFRGAYNASKYAVEGLSDTLRLELAPYGIKVVTIEPGPITSKFRDNVIDVSLKQINLEASYFNKEYKHMLTSYRDQKDESPFTKGTDAVIKKLIHAIESPRPKAKYLVTFPAHLFAVLKRILSTRMLDRLLSLASRQEMKPR